MRLQESSFFGAGVTGLPSSLIIVFQLGRCIVDITVRREQDADLGAHVGAGRACCTGCIRPWGFTTSEQDCS